SASRVQEQWRNVPKLPKMPCVVNCQPPNRLERRRNGQPMASNSWRTWRPQKRFVHTWCVSMHAAHSCVLWTAY
ncbi:MAG: hypothetical protein AVDCRST_MAG93-6845, partial [uncultured Chloroflexia bacterium]